MTWRIGLQQGSFRGARFHVESHAHGVGRRGQLHEYPMRDEPWFEDLGRKSREFSIEVFIIGENYDVERDALLAACEMAGSGTLVHPYMGSRQVVCTGCQVGERITEGRMCRFSLTFVEAGAQQFPTSISDFGSRVGVLANLVELASISDFIGGYTAGGLPGFVFDSVESAAVRFASQMLGFSVDDTFRDLLGGYSADLPELVRAPQSFAERTIDIVKQSRSTTMTSAKDTAGATTSSNNLKGLSSFSVADQTGVIMPTTTTRIAQVGNLNAFAALVRQGALASEARAVPALRFDSYNAATAYGADYVNRVDDETLLSGSEAAYLPLMNLSAAVSTDLSKRAGSLPQIKSITRNEHVPSLALAYDLYGDAKRADDVVARNRVRNPSFMPAGVPLEVLNA